MARPRSFDPDQALDLARDVFWRKGFQGTSLDDITAATGLAKPSLYAAFGDKNALFLKVLDRYHERIVANAERVLDEGPSARDAVEHWLTGFVPFCSGVRGTRGCLSVNTAADGAADQKEVRKRIERFNRKLEQLLSKRLRADRAQFSDTFDPDVSAHTIMAIYLGLMVLAKDAPDAARVRATLNQALKLLD
ncbi:MAG TPA: TetR/AcrR family transcriptional regulator [Bradyrhizobium sp.]|jgi:TetR/AcrR family transcriptional repressor of nem operon|nr:TetR/AcrR family transcriptional regulator [Bradyrhizobium sp.]